MAALIVRNLTRGRVLGESVGEAATILSRLAGLLPSRGLEAGEGLWIRPCNSIHSFGMRFVFDALFLDGEMRVVAAYPGFRRNRISGIVRGARSVLELPEGTIRGTGTEVGDRIELRRIGDAPGPPGP
jgi:uncharacterized membrane protein (UPF0127 family)